MVDLTDRVRPLATPPRAPAEPAAPLDITPSPKAPLTSFDLESPGGYARTIVGRIAYLDREANTYVVRNASGELIRVAIRDITSATDVEARSPRSAR